ncbi:uncharacterized protein LAESUDRAFT_714526 [Laetiporus sulphureus 93-53]|uniref:Uncharacterized protein n=1 Tax=Laetiporus sulphureus 93-53 TaxID=1314785 RepID=A0A165E3H7_9APHY|nr:uncharacterized protein LAESUDRAFT_714526 [Laetiporus sulphureus 93-53]KZT06178.1 hypothetical protein LAESUDRAFT_714526 [Laetiporus sulphureus 93-53]
MPLSIQAPASKVEAQQFLVGMMTSTMDGAKAAEVISSWFQVALIAKASGQSGLSDAQSFILCEAKKVRHNLDSGALAEEDLRVYYAINQIATLMPAHYDFSQTISNVVADLLCDLNNFAHHINAAGVDLASCPTVVNPVLFGLEMASLEAKDNMTRPRISLGWATQYFHEPRKLKQGYPDSMKGRAFKGHNLHPSSRNIPGPSHTPISADSPELLNEEMPNVHH